MVGEPGFDPDLTDAYRKLTDELKGESRADVLQAWAAATATASSAATTTPFSKAAQTPTPWRVFSPRSAFLLTGGSTA